MKEDKISAKQIIKNQFVATTQNSDDITRDIVYQLKQISKLEKEKRVLEKQLQVNSEAISMLHAENDALRKRSQVCKVNSNNSKGIGILADPR